jgi:pyruvate formate lyase activating enzyme
MTGSLSPVYGNLANPSMVDFPGRLAAVFFTTGCNFRCGFCHNAGLLAERKPGYAWPKLEEICGGFRDQWVDGAVVTGGEPTLEPGLGDLLSFFRRLGFAIKLDTNGSRPEVLETVLAQVDYVAMDVKCSLASYPALTGFAHTDRVRRSIELVKSQARDYEFRTTLIPGFDTDAELRDIADLIRGARRYVLQPFLPREDLPDPRLRTAPRTAPARLKQLCALMQDCATDVSVRGD